MITPSPFRYLSLAAVAIVCATLSVDCSSTCAQQMSRPLSLPSSSTPSSDGQLQTTDSPLISGTSSSSEAIPMSSALTAAQIDDILQQRPELVVELKSLLADQLQQQGINLQADSITDEMLYQQIATNPSLRANITTWLRSRGYVPDTTAHAGTGEAAPDDAHEFSRSTVFATGALPQQLATQTSQLATLQGTDKSENVSLRPKPGTPSPPARAKPAGPTAPNITDEPDVLRLPAPYNLLALRDLYTQIPRDDAKLRRFGSDVFQKREDLSGSRSGGGQQEIPIDLPVGPDYVLGAGDGLTINLWGGLSQTLTRTIDREGKIVLPEAGSLVVAGLTLQHAQAMIQSALGRQFHNAQIDVSIARLRTVRVYLVGDVQRPGAYDLSSLSTPLNALYAAGGPTSVGSLRIVRHYRGEVLVREVDLYDFMLHGLRMDDERLESGDTLLVPPVGAQVAVSGAVKRPAIYELKGQENLKEMLSDAGGATVAAAMEHISIERIQANRQRETVSLELTPETVSTALNGFGVKDGDRIYVAPILPYSERVLYVEGHVARPGKFPYRDGIQLSDVLHSYQDVLPEPAAKGDVVRLVPPDLHAETIQFDVADVLIGNANLGLQPFDTVRVYGRYEVDAPHVTIRGEVLRPGQYALSRGMTATQLVKMAGGFKRDALLETADLTSYSIEDAKKIVSLRSAISIGAAMQGRDSSADVTLKAGDILTIHQISGWSDIGASVVLSGEVTYPGSYGLQEGERLSSVLRRASGFRSTAYADGAILIRTQVKELEEKSRAELIRQIETTSASARLAPNLTGQDETSALQAAAQQQNEVLARLRSEPASGRLVLHISEDIGNWANTPADIELRSGDVLMIPKRPSFVLVSGQVYNASAITFVPGKNAGWYLSHAGGTNDVANRKEIVIVRANGSVIGRHSQGLFGGDVLATRMDPGDVIVVPQKIIGGSLVWRNLLTIAQITSSIAITAAVAGVL